MSLSPPTALAGYYDFYPADDRPEQVVLVGHSFGGGVAVRAAHDVMADLEYRVSWVNTVIKAAPMIGLLGTVVGMMGAFGSLAAAETIPVIRAPGRR